MLFNEKKAAQVAAFFLHKSSSPAARMFGQHGRMKHLKLMKLMYLAERQSLEKYGEPMIGDSLFSMNKGPMLSSTLDLINGLSDSVEGGWDAWISDRSNHQVGLKVRVDEPQRDLLELSEADLEILSDIWANFGHLDAFELADLTHEICPEWKDPKGSSIPISHEEILAVCGRSEEEIDDLRTRIRAQRRIDRSFNDARRRADSKNTKAA
jgi:uncharacterized phage-associated protein